MTLLLPPPPPLPPPLHEVAFIRSLYRSATLCGTYPAVPSAVPPARVVCLSEMRIGLEGCGLPCLPGSVGAAKPSPFISMAYLNRLRSISWVISCCALDATRCAYHCANSIRNGLTVGWGTNTNRLSGPEAMGGLPKHLDGLRNGLKGAAAALTLSLRPPVPGDAAGGGPAAL